MNMVLGIGSIRALQGEYNSIITLIDTRVAI